MVYCGCRQDRRWVSEAGATPNGAAYKGFSARTEEDGAHQAAHKLLLSQVETLGLISAQDSRDKARKNPDHPGRTTLATAPSRANLMLKLLLQVL